MEFCVGREVAEYAKKHLPTLLARNENYIAGNYDKALIESFVGIDSLLESEDGIKELKEIHGTPSAAQEKAKALSPYADSSDDSSPDTRGCTSTVILVKNRNLYIANAGDSRAVLATRGIAIDLTIDHKPDSDKEKTRIVKAGGSVTNGRVESNLNLSRALGDLKYKKNKKLKPEEQIISSYPDVVKQPISDKFDFIVIGCDGIYDSKSSQKVVDFIYKQFKDAPDAKLSTYLEKFMDDNLSPHYSKTEGLGCDNMTCVLIKFIHP